MLVRKGILVSLAIEEAAKESFVRMFPFIAVKELSDIGENSIILQTVSDYECSQELLGRYIKNIYDWKCCIPEY